jgi:hemerythrin
MLIWDETMSTGDARTDFQHKTLIEKFNDLSDIIENKSAAGKHQTAGDILDFLEFYAAWHFRQEEALMQQLNCPAADQNKREHTEFLVDFTEFKTRWLQSNMDATVLQAAHAKLAHWITDHILSVDISLRDSFEPG